MEKVTEKCVVCNGASDKKALYYPGYRIWLCYKCFNKTKHEQLIELRDKMDSEQDIILKNGGVK